MEPLSVQRIIAIYATKLSRKRAQSQDINMSTRVRNYIVCHQQEHIIRDSHTDMNLYIADIISLQIFVRINVRTVTRLSSTSITLPNTKGFIPGRSRFNVQSVSKDFLIPALIVNI